MKTATRWLSIAALVLAAIAAYWYFSPRLAMHQVREAAQRGDVAALASHVDIAAYRESLKEQWSQRVSGAVGKPADNFLSALGNMIGAAVAAPVVEAMARPEAIMNALRRGELTPLPGTAAAMAPDPELRWRYEREGMNVMVAYARSAGVKDDESALGFVLLRHGFADWKLAGVRLPAQK